MLIAWLILLFLAALIDLKIKTWATLSRLGFKSETPLAYLRAPKLYNIISNLLFIIASIIPIWNQYIPFLGSVSAIFVWVFVEIMGTIIGIKIYKSIISELNNESPDERMREVLNKTNAEIWRELFKK